MRTTWTSCIATACLLLQLTSTASPLKVTPYMQSVQPGMDAKFECGDPEDDTVAFNVVWSYNITQDNQTFVMVVPASGRIQAVNGTLTIYNVSNQDDQTYICADEASSETGVLKVYEDYDYWKEGLIVGTISLALLVLLVVCTLLEARRQRRQKKWRDVAAEKQRQKMLRQQLSLNSGSYS